MLSICEH